MLHLVHLPSGRIINVGDPLEDGLVRIPDLRTATRSAVPCVRLMHQSGSTYSLFKGGKFRDYQVIGD